ncbi:hypothetical protein [Candidatus Protochlamydia phocaeensis]|uniref:hypothetical protein n=1 Tax=Candidatus Protochlamydia phocaeensis TaxID=1414722 RepID=UPI000A6789E8|nr:hypothetical protein [Candidatus Protochlamydia phocaeensis]
MLIRFVLMTLIYYNLLSGTEKQDRPDIQRVYLTHEEVKQHADPIIQSCTSLDPFHPKTLLYFENFPLRKKIKFSLKRLVPPNHNFLKQSFFIIKEDGRIFLPPDDKGSPFFCISSRGFLPGERIYCRYEILDGSFEHEITFIPNPIQIKDEAGNVILEAELCNLIPACYKITLLGLKKSEKIKFRSVSGEEGVADSFKLSAIAPSFTYSPDVEGQKGGVAELTLIRQNGQRIRLKLPWGVQLLRYGRGNTVYSPN